MLGLVRRWLRRGGGEGVGGVEEGGREGGRGGGGVSEDEE